MPIRLEDLLSSCRRHLPVASKAPRTIELHSQSIRRTGSRHVVRLLRQREHAAVAGTDPEVVLSHLSSPSRGSRCGLQRPAARQARSSSAESQSRP